MVFDLVELPALTSTRYKPRNKARCTGSLRYADEELASLRSVTVVQDEREALIGGRMVIEWHRCPGPRAFTASGFDLELCYEERGALQRWVIPDIQILYQGELLVTQDFSELLGKELAFFAARMEHHAH